jgi:hypothetical protein
MPSEPKWTPGEDHLLLSLVDSEKVVNCNEAAKLMNEQAPLLGIDVRTYFPENIHQRLYELLRPRYRYLLPPLKIMDASDINLSMKSHQLQTAQAGSGPSQPPGPRAEPEQFSQNTENEEYAEIERYGDPELYEDLFPQLDRKCEADKEHKWIADKEPHKEHKHFMSKGAGREEERALY